MAHDLSLRVSRRGIFSQRNVVKSIWSLNYVVNAMKMESVERFGMMADEAVEMHKASSSKLAFSA